MKALYLATEDWQNHLYLHGAGVQPPVQSMQRQPHPNHLSAGLVEEVITVECRGSTTWDMIGELEKRLALARDGTSAQYLWMETTVRQAPVRAKILEGHLEILGGGTADRARGYQGLRLHLVRSEQLEEVPEPVPLNNANDIANISGIVLYNHSDADSGHVNYCDVEIDDIRGTQPSPVTLVLEAGGAPVRRLGKIITAGGSSLWNYSGSFDHVLEGEAAAAGSGCTASSNVPDGSASGGSYQSFQWSAVDEIALCSWTLSGERLAWLGGRGLRPVARLHNLPPAAVAWRWKITQTGGAVVLDRSAQVLLDLSSRLQLLPALFPPVQSPSGPYQSFTLEAWLECSTSGTKQIDLDFIHLLPLENFCYFQPLAGLTQGQELAADWHKNEFYARDAVSGEKTVSHLASGSPLWLRPGCNQRIYVLYETDAGFLIDDTCQLRLQAGARWIEP